jgi:hypothetical protein
MARGARGTRCGQRIFIFSAGMDPDGAIQVELRPLGRSKLAGAHEGKGEQFESGARLGRALIVRDRPQEPEPPRPRALRGPHPHRSNWRARVRGLCGSVTLDSSKTSAARTCVCSALRAIKSRA